MKNRWAVTCAGDLETVIPGFDPYRLGRVNSVQLDFQEGDGDVGECVARFRAVYWTQSLPEVLVELSLRGIRQMVLPELGSAVFEFSELEVMDISDRGLEGIRREVIDRGAERRFYALCHEVEVTGVFSHDGAEVVQIWP